MVDEADAGFDWPVALLRLDRRQPSMITANAAAHALLAWERRMAGPAGWPLWLWGQEPAPPGWDPVVELILQTPGGSTRTRTWPRLVDGQPQMWQASARVDGSTVWLTCLNAEAVAEAAAPSAQALLAQRDLLVREVHHRLKNNLQGVSGLLRQQAAMNPAASALLDSAAAQLQAMAQVYGLPLPGGQAPELGVLVAAVARAVGNVFGVAPEVTLPERGAQGVAGPQLRETLWAHLEGPLASVCDGETQAQKPNTPCVHPDQAGSLALVLNELMTNAIKHGAKAVTAPVCNPADEPGQGPPTPQLRCQVDATTEGAVVDILNPGVWLDRPRLEDLPPGVVGLSLVKSLLPSRGARLEFLQESRWVCARLHIRPPVLLPRAAGTPQPTERDPSAVHF